MAAKSRPSFSQNPRLIYLLCFAVLLSCELLIGLFVHDRFVRPYLGDMLVTVLLCCLLRCIWPNRPRALWLYVFCFSGAVEFLQLWGLADRLHIQNKLLRVLLGTTFDWKDIACYFCGCLLFGLAEFLLRRHKLG